jgi:flagellar M-ring protein FliF
MEKSQKSKIILITILIIASISIAIFMVTRPNYERLFNGSVDSKEIGEMSKILSDNKIDNRLADNGTSLEIKAKDKDMAQVVLAQAGYPRSGMTFKDALSSITLSTTESDKKKIFKEYDEQKIANTLKNIDNIKDAVVNLSLPEKTSFLGDGQEEAPSAAVLVESRDTLTAQQITGIERLVAGSVEGLDIKNVKIIDKNTGNALNDSGEEELNVSTTKQYEFQAKIKKDLESKIKELLGNMYDGVRVGVNAVCDFNTETTKAVEYTPMEGGKTGILRSSQLKQENVINGASTGGVPGTDTNNTSASSESYPTQSTGSQGTYTNVDQTSTYEINQKNIESTKAIGQLDTDKSSVTVSLLYGDKATAAPAPADMTTFTKMIATATGIAEKNITIASFKLPKEAAQKPKIDWMKLISQIGPILLLGILIVLLVVGVMKKVDLSGLAVAGTGRNYNYIGNNAQEDGLQEIGLTEGSEVKRQIDKFVKSKPDAVAQLLRNWLADDQWK